MWLALAGMLYPLTLGLDLYVTHKILTKNPDGELNPITRKLSQSMGPLKATILSVLLPRLLVGATLALYAPGLFLLYTGACTQLASNQIYCIKRGLI